MKPLLSEDLGLPIPEYSGDADYCLSLVLEANTIRPDLKANPESIKKPALKLEILKARPPMENPPYILDYSIVTFK